MSTLLSPEVTTVGSLADRCDRCGAAAKIKIVLPAGGDLAFCGHHGTAYAGAINKVAARIEVDGGFGWGGVPAP